MLDWHCRTTYAISGEGFAACRHEYLRSFVFMDEESVWVIVDLLLIRIIEYASGIRTFFL